MFSNESASHLNCSNYGQYFPIPASLLMSVCLEVFHGYYSHASARHSLPGFFCYYFSPLYGYSKTDISRESMND
ncbi:hypothetical protein DET64_10874 [Marinobacter nauticus]|uniref:Uncharacterized protein n=1 Tax=Marinobacter nauticus TaxID=2743 RepID=A0A368UVM6_MARNT|nr:hypothetical protein DET64_10874 [Marinobacter nauticus]RCW32849.1 hypothetical protein DET51_10874 [Marinobacter nauticus]